MNTQVSSGAFLQNATVYDRRAKAVLGEITAQSDTLETFDPEHHEFYCPDCLDQGYAMRIVHRPEDLTGADITPSRFVHYRYDEATHICDHPVRYKRLDELAVRYNAERIGPHSYIFDLDLRYERDNNLRVVDRASRMAKLTLALLYDPALRAKQKIRFADGSVRPFEEGLYRPSPDEKIRLFNDTYRAAEARHYMPAAQIFRPIANRRLWKAFEAQNCIPGIAGRKVDYAGLKMQPSTVLWCTTKKIYWQVSQMCAHQAAGKDGAALMIVGDSQFSFKRANERVAGIRAGAKLPMALHNVFKIQHDSQVVPWQHTATFAEAAAKHAHTQEAAQETVLKRQKVLAL